MLNRRSVVSLMLATACVLLVGCKKPIAKEAPDYLKELPPGQHALRKIIDPRQLPDLSIAFAGRDPALMMALDRSFGWFARPTTKQYFPINDITHEQAEASVFAFREILRTATSAEEFRTRINQELDTYISVGWDMNGIVLFTGYYSGVFEASRTQGGEFQHPLYRRPSDLVTDPLTGDTKGRRVGESLETYPTRAQIETSNMLAGSELVWLKSKLDVYVVQVNGSARLSLTDGSTLYVGYAGSNGAEYTSVGRLLVQDGKIEKNRLSLTTLREYFKTHPQDLDTYTRRNDRYVFFQEYMPELWPAGSLGVKVTDFRTLATDKKIFPRGSVALAITTSPQGTPGSGRGPVAEGVTGARFDQFMLDQDAGGAIRAPGRADIYMGVGPAAEALAGHQYAEGRLYYFFLKPERVEYWRQMMQQAKAAKSMS